MSDSPALATFFQTIFRVSGVVLLVAVALSLLDRLLHASPLTRRTLAPLLVVSIVRTLAVAAFVATGAEVLSGVVLVALFWAVPLSMALGLLLGRLYAAAALQRLVSGLQRRPDADELRAVMADVLEDRSLTIAYWLPEQAQWMDAAGGLTDAPPVAGHDQSVTFARQPDGAPVAALVHDEALLEQPALLGAVTASTRFALESNRLQAELSLADERVADARSSGRRELERDLHDGAQQRLIALRMKVSVLTRLLHTDVHRAGELAAELGPDIDATLQEVRDLGHGRGPRLLVESGIGARPRVGGTQRADARHVHGIRSGEVPRRRRNCRLLHLPRGAAECRQDAARRQWRFGPDDGLLVSPSRTLAAAERRRRPGGRGWACASGWLGRRQRGGDPAPDGDDGARLGAWTGDRHRVRPTG